MEQNKLLIFAGTPVPSMEESSGTGVPCGGKALGLEMNSKKTKQTFLQPEYQEGPRMRVEGLNKLGRNVLTIV